MSERSAARSTVAGLVALLAIVLLMLTMIGRRPAIAMPPDKQGKPSAAPTNSPQPKSNADNNPGGANNGGDCGAYCSTRDGSKSGNGNGGGKANGKPCAGCVGKADNKNPPGQFPDGSDHNNGYECDGNNGIAKTNPAHTGCTTPPPSPECTPTAEQPCETPSPECTPTAEQPCETPSPECTPTAEQPCETPSPECTPTAEVPCETPSVLPTTVTATPTVSETASPTVTPSVLGVKIVKPQAGGTALPQTGLAIPVGLLLLAGFGLMALGLSIVVAPTRTTS
jgi:hypothetical protein